ncbi:MAG: dTMP kinase [Desulfobacterales bacterium]
MMSAQRNPQRMFITLEGIEGAGKSTLMPFVVDLLKRRGHDCLVTREPGGTGIGRRIREILLDPESRDIHPHTELLLYFADRTQHAREKILPALEAGRTVVCDRFVDATIVYQGIARGLGRDLVEDLHGLMLDNLKPDLTLLFDLPPRVGLSRAWRQLQNGVRAAAESRFESETITFHEKVRAGYLSLATSEPHRYRILDASGDIPSVETQVRRILDDWMADRSKPPAASGTGAPSIS